MKLIGLMWPIVVASIAQFPSCRSQDPPPGTVTFEDGFETGLSRWSTGADVPADPNRPGETVAWSITASQDRAFQGSRSARFSLDGRQDDGTIWIERAFSGLNLSRSYRVTLTFEFWSDSESFNTLAKVAAYAGPADPAAEEDFDTEDAANLRAVWRTYTYEFDTMSSAGGQLWVALGISAVWETEMTYYVDNVEIEIQPR